MDTEASKSDTVYILHSYVASNDNPYGGGSKAVGAAPKEDTRDTYAIPATGVDAVHRAAKEDVAEVGVVDTVEGCTVNCTAGGVLDVNGSVSVAEYVAGNPDTSVNNDTRSSSMYRV